MPTHAAAAELPYTPQQVFDRVSDIENYPKFLRHVVSARIRRRDGNRLWVDQVVQVKALRLRFSTIALLNPPLGIHVVCGDSLFGTFDEKWDFAAAPAGGERILAAIPNS